MLSSNGKSVRGQTQATGSNGVERTSSERQPLVAVQRQDPRTPLFETTNETTYRSYKQWPASFRTICPDAGTKLLGMQKDRNRTPDIVLPILKHVLEFKQTTGISHVIVKSMWDDFRNGKNDFPGIKREHVKGYDLPSYKKLIEKWCVRCDVDGKIQLYRIVGSGAFKPPLLYGQALDKVKSVLRKFGRKCTVGELEDHLAQQYFLPSGVVKTIFSIEKTKLKIVPGVLLAGSQNVLVEKRTRHEGADCAGNSSVTKNLGGVTNGQSEQHFSRCMRGRDAVAKLRRNILSLAMKEEKEVEQSIQVCCDAMVDLSQKLRDGTHAHGDPGCSPVAVLEFQLQHYKAQQTKITEGRHILTQISARLDGASDDDINFIQEAVDQQGLSVSQLAVVVRWTIPSSISGL